MQLDKMKEPTVATAPAATVSGTKVTTSECRTSYVHLDAPYLSPTIQNGTAKYSVVLLIPKGDTKTYEAIRAAEEAAIQIGIQKKWGGDRPHKLASLIHDGDTEADLKQNPEYAGHWYMSVSNTQRPGVVDKNLQPIMDGSDLYSGMWVLAALNAYPYNTSGNKGVSFGLNNLVKWRDDEALAGSASAESDFAFLKGTESPLL